jgi:siroheme synthase (precorrin-2 oxidase/ferrochelatase)
VSEDEATKASSPHSFPPFSLNKLRKEKEEKKRKKKKKKRRRQERACEREKVSRGVKRG